MSIKRFTGKSNGFTLIELMLALSFIGVLLITMLLTIIHITNLYSKGLTIKSINQAGRDLGASIRRDATSLSSVATPLIQPDVAGAGELGRLCLGSFSYIWSPAAKLSDNTAVTYSDTTDTPIVLARVADAGGSYCRQLADGSYRTDVQRAQSSELLPADQGDYALHSFSLERVPAMGLPATGEVLYDIRYTVGTNDQGSIDTVDRSCKPPEDASNNFNFCSVNTFEVMVRAG